MIYLLGTKIYSQNHVVNPQHIHRV